MYTNLENAFITAVAKITGLDPNKGQIRVAYAEEPAPSWKHTDDVIAFYIEPLAEEYAEDYYETTVEDNDKLTRTTTFTDVVKINVSCYGPNSRIYAKKIQVYIQKNDYRRALAQIGAYPVLKSPSPKYIPYEYNKQWWQRTDLELTFNVKTNFTDTTNFIKSVNISVITDKGDTRDVITDQTSG